MYKSSDTTALIYSFLNKQPLMVLSTVHKKRKAPESALVAFSQTKNLELIFQTQNDTRKYLNLQKNCSVSAVVGFSETKHITLQYEGEAKEISDKNNLEYYIKIFKKKNTPCGDRFIYHPKASFFLISPKWIALSDYHDKKPKVIEWKKREIR